MRRNLLWCILGTQPWERRPGPGRCGQQPPCPPTPPAAGKERDDLSEAAWRPAGASGLRREDDIASPFSTSQSSAPSSTPPSSSPGPTLGYNSPRAVGSGDLLVLHSCDHTNHSRTAGRSAGNPVKRARTGPSSSQSYARLIHGRCAGKATPGPSRAPEPAQPCTVPSPNQCCTQGTAGRANTPGHSRCLGSGPTTHSPNTSRGTLWAAGQQRNPGIQVAPELVPPRPAPAIHARGGGPARVTLKAGTPRPQHTPTGTKPLDPKGGPGHIWQRVPAGHQLLSPDQGRTRYLLAHGLNQHRYNPRVWARLAPGPGHPSQWHEISRPT